MVFFHEQESLHVAVVVESLVALGAWVMGIGTVGLGDGDMGKADAALPEGAGFWAGRMARQAGFCFGHGWGLEGFKFFWHFLFNFKFDN